MKNNEIRGKRGDLDEIQKAKLGAIDAKNIKRIDQANKDIEKIKVTVNMIPDLAVILNKFSKEEELI